MTFVKSVHKRLRNAGYEKRRSTYEVGPKVYATHADMMSGRIEVYIPGNWSIPLLRKYQGELLELFKDLNPETSYGSSIVIRASKG